MQANLSDLDGRVAFVTGGSGRIGSAVVGALATEGVRVAVGYRDNQTAAHSVASQHAHAVPISIDVTDPTSVDSAFAEVERTLGPVGILVNCAGARQDGLLLRMSDDAWDNVLSVNLRGAFLCTRRVLLAMVQERWGRVISMGSPAGTLGSPGQANYAAAKAGLEAFTRSVAREVGRKGITLNVVVPGLLDSAMTATIDASIHDRIVELSATGELALPEDIARAVVFLALTPSATGSILRVDGGLF